VDTYESERFSGRHGRPWKMNADDSGVPAQ
jgi:hypothetical protein